MDKLSDTQLMKETIDCSLQLLDFFSEKQVFSLLQKMLSLSLSLALQNLSSEQTPMIISQAFAKACSRNT